MAGVSESASFSGEGIRFVKQYYHDGGFLSSVNADNFYRFSRNGQQFIRVAHTLDSAVGQRLEFGASTQRSAITGWQIQVYGVTDGTPEYYAF